MSSSCCSFRRLSWRWRADIRFARWLCVRHHSGDSGLCSGSRLPRGFDQRAEAPCSPSPSRGLQAFHHDNVHAPGANRRLKLRKSVVLHRRLPRGLQVHPALDSPPTAAAWMAGPGPSRAQTWLAAGCTQEWAGRKRLGDGSLGCPRPPPAAYPVATRSLEWAQSWLAASPRQHAEPQHPAFQPTISPGSSWSASVQLPPLQQHQCAGA